MNSVTPEEMADLITEFMLRPEAERKTVYVSLYEGLRESGVF